MDAALITGLVEAKQFKRWVAEQMRVDRRHGGGEPSITNHPDSQRPGRPPADRYGTEPGQA
jgi:hypothetical protein